MLCATKHKDDCAVKIQLNPYLPVAISYGFRLQPKTLS